MEKCSSQRVTKQGPRQAGKAERKNKSSWVDKALKKREGQVKKKKTRKGNSANVRKKHIKERK